MKNNKSELTIVRVIPSKATVRIEDDGTLKVLNMTNGEPVLRWLDLNRVERSEKKLNKEEK